MNVAGVELPYTNLLQSSTQGVAGQHSMRDFLGPSNGRFVYFLIEHMMLY
jgi:hypothetical protein